MRFVTFDDPLGDQVVVNVDLIRTMDGDTDNDGPCLLYTSRCV